MLYACAARFDVTENLENFLVFWVKALFSSKKFCKIFQILHHIESLDACIEY